MAKRFRPPYSVGDPFRHFTARPDHLYDVTVVGNGPISEDDRVEINKSRNVIRFNDINHWRPGEPTTLRVQRFPEIVPLKRRCNASVWAVAASPRSMPEKAALYTWVYEWQFTHGALARPGFLLWPVAQVLEPWANSVRIFENCSSCGIRCFANQTSSGPSTGGLILSELHALPQIDVINVYGMNWGGDIGHIDFLYPNIVPECCTKCRFHKTLTSKYGDGGLHYDHATHNIAVTASATGGALLAAKVGLALFAVFHGGKHVHRKLKERQAAIATAAAASASMINVPQRGDGMPLLGIPCKSEPVSF